MYFYKISLKKEDLCHLKITDQLQLHISLQLHTDYLCIKYISIESLIGDDSMLWHIILVLEEALEKSTTNAHLKLLLVYLYGRISKSSVHEVDNNVLLKWAWNAKLSLLHSFLYYATHDDFLSKMIFFLSTEIFVENNSFM